jgi:hypothetical protein
VQIAVLFPSPSSSLPDIYSSRGHIPEDEEGRESKDALLLDRKLFRIPFSAFPSDGG